MRLPPMTTQRCMIMAAVVAILLAFGFCLINHITTSAQIAFADGQTEVFDQMRRQTAEAAAVDVSTVIAHRLRRPYDRRWTDRSEDCAGRRIAAVPRPRRART
jgi:hypothetical protein